VTLSPESKKRVQEWLKKAPPLSERQADLIATAFRGAITVEPARGRGRG
jgi:hypothetical protein